MTREESHAKWLNDNGDATHRLNYLLDSNSLVFDVGAFEGNWATQIYQRYTCKLWLFEPVKEYINALKFKFEFVDDVKVFPFGLGANTMNCYISADGDGSKPGEQGNPCLIKSINEFITENNIQNVDLLKVNIEGAEYSLFESLIDKNRVKLFDNIQVQFHTWEIDFENRHEFIVNELQKTHDLVYHYPFIWSGFKRK